MQIKTLALAVLIAAGSSAHANEGGSSVDGATIEAIRAAAQQMASAAASVRLAMDNVEVEPKTRAVNGN